MLGDVRFACVAQSLLYIFNFWADFENPREKQPMQPWLDLTSMSSAQIQQRTKQQEKKSQSTSLLVCIVAKQRVVFMEPNCFFPLPPPPPLLPSPPLLLWLYYHVRKAWPACTGEHTCSRQPCCIVFCCVDTKQANYDTTWTLECPCLLSSANH